MRSVAGDADGASEMEHDSDADADADAVRCLLSSLHTFLPVATIKHF